jgi:AAA15 family ATPase/GTPase
LTDASFRVYLYRAESVSPKKQAMEPTMRLSKVIIEGFRCHSTQMVFNFSDLTAIVGKNDSGKSSILEALQFFFDESRKPDPEDVSIFNDVREFRVGCVFDDYPNVLILDSMHPTSLKEEYLLNADGQLEIHKIVDCNLKNTESEENDCYCVAPDGRRLC